MALINREKKIWAKAENTFHAKTESLIKYIYIKEKLLDNYNLSNNNELEKAVYNELNKGLKKYASKLYFVNSKSTSSKKKITLVVSIENIIKKEKNKKCEKKVSANINIVFSQKQNDKLIATWKNYLSQIKTITDSKGMMKSIEALARFKQTMQISPEELIGPGYIGMLTSVPYFDYNNDKRASFRTYSSYAIKNGMDDYINSYTLKGDLDEVKTESEDESNIEESPEDIIIKIEVDNEAEAKKKKMLEELRKALNKLPKRRRLIYQKRQFENKTNNEIAKELRINPPLATKEFKKAEKAILSHFNNLEISSSILLEIFPD